MTVSRGEFDGVILMPFAYRAKVARLKQGTERIVLAGRLPLILDRLSSQDAPVAARAGKEVFRRRDGAWLRPVRLPSGELAGVADFERLLERARRQTVVWSDYPLCDAEAGLPYSPFGKGVELDDDLPRGWTVKSSERGIREGFAKAASATLLNVEGVLWRPCPEPFLVLRAGGAGVSGDLVVEVVVRADPRNDCAFFRLDQGSEAMFHATEVADHFNKRCPCLPDLDLLDPSILEFDPASSLAERIAWILEGKRRSAWLDPRDLEADPSGKDMTRILAAVDRYVAGSDPFPVLAATSSLLRSGLRDSSYGAFLRKGFMQIAEPQLMRWAAAYGDALAMSAEEDAAVFGIAGP
jgi:hypothetical protein